LVPLSGESPLVVSSPRSMRLTRGSGTGCRVGGRLEGILASFSTGRCQWRTEIQAPGARRHSCHYQCGKEPPAGPTPAVGADMQGQPVTARILTKFVGQGTNRRVVVGPRRLARWANLTRPTPSTRRLFPCPLLLQTSENFPFNHHDSRRCTNRFPLVQSTACAVVQTLLCLHQPWHDALHQNTPCFWGALLFNKQPAWHDMTLCRVKLQHNSVTGCLLDRASAMCLVNTGTRTHTHPQDKPAASCPTAKQCQQCQQYQQYQQQQ
jgi:hypothetical protein